MALYVLGESRSISSGRETGLSDLIPSRHVALRSFSKLTAFEAARVLTKLGADVRVYNPSGLPLKDDTSDKHEKVQELRALSEWSDGQLWCCPEQHGAITGVFKTQSESCPLHLRR
jgi:arsenic resistance protein ArsH